ncbi:MAG: geranylgeranylglyceryl/heptaprenylglyceryl phosphate synthase [Bacteroidales bacterium]|nr:geranylgeranylglyceryl/heptaprenylglyceryl phosphate synthase [Bacteroidales bacterium]
MTIYQKYFTSGEKHIAVLLDPDKLTVEKTAHYGSIIENSPASMIFIGGSLVNKDIEKTIEILKNETQKPVVIFPGSGSQFSDKADALLFLSLISGRNPEYLIGEQVKTAYKIKKSGIETIPTGYVLIDGGTVTSVQYVSNTMPIPSDKTDLAVSTAIAGELLGLKCFYLEAGSGAKFHVKKEIISAVKQNVSSPIIVGGGIRSIETVSELFSSGADIAVIGTAFENNPDFFKTSRNVLV